MNTIDLHAAAYDLGIQGCSLARVIHRVGKGLSESELEMVIEGWVSAVSDRNRELVEEVPF